MSVPAARIVFPSEDRARVASQVDDALRTGALTLGGHTREFEEAFARRHQSPYGVAVSSGTSALEILLRCLGVAGAEVVVPANTFFATAAAVIHAGGRVRLADVDPTTMALSADTLTAAITGETRAVILVHIGGLVTPVIEAIADLCRERGVHLVEDAAHAHGSAHRGRPAGTFGVASAFSFYPTKVITSGEGGMILTADEGLAEEARVYRDQGKAGFHGGAHVRMGYAWRMSELHAAVGLAQLGRLDEFLAVRQASADIYARELGDVEGLTLQPVWQSCTPNHYKYVVFLDDQIDRDGLKSALSTDHGVSLSGEVYAAPLHHQPVFESLAHGPLPGAETACRSHVCLPVFSDMKPEEARHVAGSLRRVLSTVGAGATPA